MALTSALSAQAQDEYDEEAYYEKETATYMELTFAGSWFDINDDDGDDRGSGAVGAIVGAHVAGVKMELQYEWYDYSSTSVATYNLGYTFRSTESIQPYVKGGIGILGGRPDHAFLFAGRVDAGVNFFLTEQWAIAPAIGYIGAAHSNDIFTGRVGVVYYFE
jgi:hypothetical protein